MTINKVATIEIPVTNIQRSVYWYKEILQLHLLHHDENFGTAMLSLTSKGAPTLYLVEVEEMSPLAFYNQRTGITHSIIDFYTNDLKSYHKYLLDQGVDADPLEVKDGAPGGFGFRDPDGNRLSVCNINHEL